MGNGISLISCGKWGECKPAVRSGGALPVFATENDPSWTKGPKGPGSGASY